VADGATVLGVEAPPGAGAAVGAEVTPGGKMTAGPDPGAAFAWL